MLSSIRQFIMRYIVGAMREYKEPVNVQEKELSRLMLESRRREISAASRTVTLSWNRVDGSVGHSGQAGAPRRAIRKLFKICIVTVALIWLGAWGSVALAATCTSNAGAVNWGAAATWSCGNIPAAGDVVIIPNGSTVTFNANTNTLASLQIDSGGTLAIAAGSAADVNLGGNLVNNGTINLNASGSTNVIYLVGNNITSTFSGSGTWLLDRIDLNGTGGAACTGTCKVELSGSPNLQFYNATPISGQSATDTVNALGNATATITLVRAGVQAIVTTGVTYPNLVLTGSGAKNPAAGTLNILGNLILSGTATSTTAGNLSVGGNLAVGAGTTLTVTGFNIAVNGITSVTGTLTHNNTAGTKTYTGNITINNGGTWNNSANENITMQGGLTNNGTFTAGTGVYTFNTNNQSFGGTSATTIPNVTVTGVTLTNNGNLTVTTALDGGTGTLVNTDTLNIGFVGPPGINTLNASAIGNTVNYNRAGAQTVEPTSYYDLTLSNSGVKTSAGSFIVRGNLAITGVTFESGATIQTVNGNVSNTGTHTATTGSITLSGGTAVHVLSGTGTYANLIMNDAFGATLSASPTVSGVLTLTNGIFTTGANVLEVRSSCATGIVRTGGFVMGNLSLHYPTNAGTTICTFPIGDATGYTPVTVAMANVTSNLANSILTARTDPSDHPDTTALLSGIDPGKSVNRTWTLTPGGALSFVTFNATFSFLNGDIDGGANTANFIIGRKSGGVWTYPTVGTKNLNDTTATGITQASGFGVFAIGERAMPSITAVKAVSTFSDPYNNTTNPKSIPGAVMLYTVTVINSGLGPVDANTTTVTDTISVNTSMCVSNLCSNPPVTFTCSAAPACGLTYTYATTVTYTNRAGGVGPYDYTPVPDADGYDAAVTGFSVNPAGVFNWAAGAPYPQITIQFKVKIK